MDKDDLSINYKILTNFQSRTDRIVFKLFGKDPGDFPTALRKEVFCTLAIIFFNDSVLMFLLYQFETKPSLFLGNCRFLIGYHTVLQILKATLSLVVLY